jgi:hypothetical protein
VENVGDGRETGCLYTACTGVAWLPSYTTLGSRRSIVNVLVGGSSINPSATNREYELRERKLATG